MSRISHIYGAKHSYVNSKYSELLLGSEIISIKQFLVSISNCLLCQLSILPACYFSNMSLATTSIIFTVMSSSNTEL